jgi:hypothetical protein
MTPLQKGLFAWLPPVFRISEEQVFKMVGLDAAVFLRLHHLGIRFFGILTYVRNLSDVVGACGYSRHR